MESHAMPLVVETSLLIKQCRWELMRLKQLAEDFKAANERSLNFLAGAFRLETPNNAEPASPTGSATSEEIRARC